jgi:hypothetical protein
MECQRHFGRLLRPAILFLAIGGTTRGATWNEINSGLPNVVPGIEALTVDSRAPSTIYARTNEGRVFKSTDGAGSWRPLSTITGVYFLAVDPKTSGILYASTSRGNVLKSVDGGESWIGAVPGWPTYGGPPLRLTRSLRRRYTQPRFSAASSRARMQQEAGNGCTALRTPRPR